MKNPRSAPAHAQLKVVFLLVLPTKFMIVNNNEQYCLSNIAEPEYRYTLFMATFTAKHVSIFLINIATSCWLRKFASGKSSVSQNKLLQLILGYIYILKYLQSNFIG